MCSGAKDRAEGARGTFLSWQDLKTRAERGTAAPSALSSGGSSGALTHTQAALAQSGWQ